MIELGKVQELVVQEKVDFGVYLGEFIDSEEKVLLPRKQVPEDTDVSDRIDVFIYKDTQDRIIATTNRPYILLHEIKKLKVLNNTGVGAFLDWGLEKDLLLPFAEQKGRVKEGQEVLVALYVDKSSRLCATMSIQKYMQQDISYEKDTWVNGVVYSVNDQIGAFICVEEKYDGLINKHELLRDYAIGESIEARIVDITEDSKLKLSLTDKVSLQMDKDAVLLLALLSENNGELEINDKSDAELIKKVAKMSKRAFKRAVGRLMKEGKIVQKDHSIQLVK